MNPATVSCHHCKKQFATKANLKRHIRYSHEVEEEDRIQCPLCTKTRSRRNDMVREHLAKTHPKEAAGYRAEQLLTVRQSREKKNTAATEEKLLQESAPKTTEVTVKVPTLPEKEQVLPQKELTTGLQKQDNLDTNNNLHSFIEENEEVVDHFSQQFVGYPLLEATTVGEDLLSTLDNMLAATGNTTGGETPTRDYFMQPLPITIADVTPAHIISIEPVPPKIDIHTQTNTITHQTSDTQTDVLVEAHQEETEEAQPDVVVEVNQDVVVEVQPEEVVVVMTEPHPAEVRVPRNKYGQALAIYCKHGVQRPVHRHKRVTTLANNKQQQTYKDYVDVFCAKCPAPQITYINKLEVENVAFKDLNSKRAKYSTSESDSS